MAKQRDSIKFIYNLNMHLILNLIKRVFFCVKLMCLLLLFIFAVCYGESKVASNSQA